MGRSQANADTLYASYNGPQLGFTIRDANTLSQHAWRDTGIVASGIAVDDSSNVYLPAANHLRKYSPDGTLLTDMAFPIASINYTAIAFSGGHVYASYNGSQRGVTQRDANTLKQVQYFDTGINAEGISVDSGGNIYLSAGNRLRKYSNDGVLQQNMTFPVAGINYSGVAIK